MTSGCKLRSAAAGLAFAALALPASAQVPSSCAGLPSWGQLQAALSGAVGASGNGGLGFNMWGTVVANDGTVCAVAFTGSSIDGQWLGSRLISAQKANTANDFSLGKGVTPANSAFGTNGLALSTANLYSAVQPGGSLYGLQQSNPVDASRAYNGYSKLFGTSLDPMTGQRIGGVNVFGGGLALYKKGGVKVGAVGVSGDTSCTDHFVAWNVRHNLNLDFLAGVGGVSGDPSHPDNIIYDISPASGDGLLNPNGNVGASASGYGHPTCAPPTGNPAALPAVQS